MLKSSSPVPQNGNFFGSSIIANVTSCMRWCWSSVVVSQVSHSVMSDSLWPRGLQHSRLPCPSPTPGAYSNSCPSSRWCHPTISSSVIPFTSRLQSFPTSGSFPMSQGLFLLRIRWPKYWSFIFSISPSNEYSGLISFRIDQLDLHAVQGTLEGLLYTTIQKYQFFSPQLFLKSNTHINK